MSSYNSIANQFVNKKWVKQLRVDASMPGTCPGSTWKIHNYGIIDNLTSGPGDKLINKLGKEIYSKL